MPQDPLACEHARSSLLLEVGKELAYARPFA
jgi:hypothetical protein